MKNTQSEETKPKTKTVDNPGVSGPGVSRTEVIEDLKRVQAEYPDVTITRNFYRDKAKYGEAIWQGFFPTFADFRKAAGIAVNEADEKKGKEEQTNSDLIFKGNYVYNSDADTYITFLDRAGQRIILSGEQHRGMLQRYSNWDGEAATINEICRDFSMRRDWFIEYKSVHGWTHDKEPFSNEELLQRSDEDMVQDALQMRRLALFKTFEKAKWRETKANSDKWVNFEQNVLIPLQNHISANAPTHKVPMLNIRASKMKFAVVLAPFDLHYGKAGWMDETGASYSRKEARELLLHHSREQARLFSAFGKPEKIIVASASDYFHIDNQQHTTTNGTPQDVDGTRSQILIEGCELAVEHAEMIAQIAPVEWLGVAGNHDQDSALTVMLYLRAWFNNNKNVRVDVSPSLRRCSEYGNSALAFFHGHGLKVGDLHAVMMKQFRDIWRRTDRHYAFSGHLHHEVVREIHGIKHYQVSSLAGEDRYHAKNGYITSDRALQSYIVSRDRGVIAEFISPHLDSTAITGIRTTK